LFSPTPGFRHQFLNFIRFDWNARHQIFCSVFNYEHVVLKANGEAFLANVNGRLGTSSKARPSASATLVGSYPMGLEATIGEE